VTGVRAARRVRLVPEGCGLVPSPSGSNDEWQVVPGSTATVIVTTADGTSNAASLTIGSG
jgi:hypothetical protein